MCLIRDINNIDQKREKKRKENKESSYPPHPARRPTIPKQLFWNPSLPQILFWKWSKQIISKYVNFWNPIIFPSVKKTKLNSLSMHRLENIIKLFGWCHLYREAAVEGTVDLGFRLFYVIFLALLFNLMGSGQPT